MKLHNRESYLRTQAEGKAQKRLFPKVTQLFYIAFIVIIFGYILYYMFSSLFLLQSLGYVEIEKVKLGAVHGGRVSYLNHDTMEVIKKGDLLVSIDPAKFCDRDIFKTKSQNLSFQIEDESIKLAGMRGELKLLQIFLDELDRDNGLRRALELDAPLLKKQVDMTREIMQLKNDILTQNERVRNLEQRKKLADIEHQEILLDPACETQNIYAPFDGYVFSVSFVVDEVPNRGDTVLTVVSEEADVRIELYLETEEFESVVLGKIFNVILPDGSATEAIVAAVRSTAEIIPERKWDDYSPAKPGVLVHLLPLNDDAKTMWKRFDRYQVKVRGVK